MLMTFLMSSRSFSQSILVSSESLDTTICFNLNQSRFLLKQHYRWEECDKLLGIADQTIGILNKTIGDKEEIIGSQEQSIANLQNVVKAKQSEISRLNFELDKSKVEIQKHKNNRIWYFLGGGLVGGLFGLYYR